MQTYRSKKQAALNISSRNLQTNNKQTSYSFVAMKIYYGSLLNVALVAAASQLLAQVDVAYAKLSSSSMRRLLPDDRIADHILSESNTHFIIAAEIEDGAAHPDIHVRLSEDAVTEHTIISYDDGSSRRRGLSSRRVLVSTMAGTFSTISVHTKDGTARGIVQQPGEASKDIVQEQGQRTLISKSEELGDTTLGMQP